MVSLLPTPVNSLLRILYDPPLLNITHRVQFVVGVELSTEAGTFPSAAAISC